MSAALQPARGGSGLRLWKHNYRILMGSGYWVLVLPVAASQVVTLWMFALATDFGQTAATYIAEMMTPILGAFLVAHSMAPEYRSSIGAVLACKPVSLHRVVSMRAGLAMLAAALLSVITLQICSNGLKPVDVWTPLAASLPGLWFLSMLALTFATLFRSALGGFAAAAALWALDFRLGFGIHPFLSLQAYGVGATARQGLEQLWPYNKAVLLVAGLALLLLHNRLLPRICRAPERQDLLRITGAVATLALLYCLSGAVTTVSYAWLNRSRLLPNDVTWLRRTLDLYGPVPIAAFFGPDFSVLVAKPPASRDAGNTRALRIRQLEQALLRYPNGLWSDGLANALGDEKSSSDPMGALQAYQDVADRFGSSPYAPRALHKILILEGEGVTPGHRLAAARRLIAEYPHRGEAARGAHLLADSYPQTIRGEELLSAARVAHKVDHLQERPGWLVTQGLVLRDLGRREEAVQALRAAREEALTLQQRSGEPGSGLATFRAQIDSALVEADRLLRELGAAG